jgi:hypothetical protein
MGPRLFSRFMILLPIPVSSMLPIVSEADHSPHLAHCGMFGRASCCRFHLHHSLLVSSLLQTLLTLDPRYSHYEI